MSSTLRGSLIAAGASVELSASSADASVSSLLVMADVSVSSLRWIGLVGREGGGQLQLDEEKMRSRGSTSMKHEGFTRAWTAEARAR
eukprot:14780613-Heterocapsa_arctica.AAC.1